MKPWYKPSLEAQWAELQRLQRLQRIVSVLEPVACALLGLLAGLAYGLGYIADLPSWLR